MTTNLSFWIFVGVFGVVALVRLGELVVSVRRLRAKGQGFVPEPGLFPLMVLVHTGLLTAPWLEVLFLERPLVPWLAISAGSVLVLATALRV